MRRIICVGNRYVAADAAGPAVHERLRREGLPDGVDLVDGGLGGLSLLGLLDGMERVVFVDRTSGFGPEGSVVVLAPEEAARTAERVYGHDAGLGYLLRALPFVTEDPPELAVVGLEGFPTEELVAEGARVAREIAARESA